MGNSFLYRMPSGVPGAITRESVATIESNPMDPAKPFSAYGLAGKIVGDNFVPLVSGDAESVVFGILVRPYPTTGANASDPLGVDVPIKGGVGNTLKRGYIAVKNYQGSPAKNGAVYVRVADTDATGHPIGSFSASQDATTPADTPQLPGAYFTGTADADGNVEIAYNL